MVLTHGGAGPTHDGSAREVHMRVPSTAEQLLDGRRPAATRRETGGPHHHTEESMSPRRVLIVYGTTHGQTAKVARYMADVLTASGCVVTVADADQLPRGLTLRDFDGIVVGSSVTYGRHQRRIRRFVRAHRDTLNGTRSAFFSVSGAAAGDDEAARARAEQYVDEFLRETGWLPWLAEPVAGAMAYTTYSPLLRWLMKHISQQSGGPTDTSRDHEFTDWAQVRRFAEAFAALVPDAEATRPLVTA
jgi:menaquinone-dependent protoporphyrinogen oxidase